MSVIRVRSSTKWMKDNYSMYKGSVTKKKSKKSSSKKKVNSNKPNTKQNRKPKLLHEDFYNAIIKRGENIQQNSKPEKMARNLLKRSAEQYLQPITIESIFRAYKITKQKVENNNSDKFFIYLRRELANKSISRSIINRLTEGRPKLYKEDKRKPVNKKKEIPIKKLVAENYTPPMSDQERRRLNKLALQPKYKK